MVENSGKYNYLCNVYWHQYLTESDGSNILTKFSVNHLISLTSLISVLEDRGNYILAYATETDWSNIITIKVISSFPQCCAMFTIKESLIVLLNAIMKVGNDEPMRM